MGGSETRETESLLSFSTGKFGQRQFFFLPSSFFPSSFLLLLYFLPPFLSSPSFFPSFLQAAKADPMNAEVFVYLGHYQREINGDLKYVCCVDTSEYMHTMSI